MHVVGLTGYAESGKSTTAQYLVEQHGFTRLSFAAPLKKMLRTLDPLLGEHRLSALFGHYGDENAIKSSPWGNEYRRLLQVYFWVLAAGRQMTDPEGRYVFDDARFPNEADFIKSLNPYGLWNIDRPGFGPTNSHASEQHAGKLGETVWLWNTDLESLHDQIDNSVDMIFGGVKA
jgi:hypothetical protein